MIAFWTTVCCSYENWNPIFSLSRIDFAKKSVLCPSSCKYVGVCCVWETVCRTTPLNLLPKVWFWEQEFIFYPEKIWVAGNLKIFLVETWKKVGFCTCKGTVPILRQQRDWVGGVRKMSIFADFQYYLCWCTLRRVDGSEKVQKFCCRNVEMVF